MKETELFWLAGILEGEGSFCKGPPSSPNLPTVSCQMTDEDTISRVAELLGVSYAYHKPRKTKWKPVYSTHIRGRRARELMTSLAPLMSKRRQMQIVASIQSYDPFKIQRRWLHNQKMDDTMLVEAKKRIDGGESLRSVARSYAVHHESLRRRLT